MPDSSSQMEAAFRVAREVYSELGIDLDVALEHVKRVPISLHCWQGDDVGGFEDEIMKYVREYEFSLYCLNRKLVLTDKKGYQERVFKGSERRKLAYKEFKSTWLGALHGGK